MDKDVFFFFNNLDTKIRSILTMNNVSWQGLALQKEQFVYVKWYICYSYGPESANIKIKTFFELFPEKWQFFASHSSPPLLDGVK